jgi:hypothetical protein
MTIDYAGLFCSLTIFFFIQVEMHRIGVLHADL